MPSGLTTNAPRTLADRQRKRSRPGGMQPAARFPMRSTTARPQDPRAQTRRAPRRGARGSVVSSTRLARSSATSTTTPTSAATARSASSWKSRGAAQAVGELGDRPPQCRRGRDRQVDPVGCREHRARDPLGPKAAEPADEAERDRRRQASRLEAARRALASRPAIGSQASATNPAAASAGTLIVPASTHTMTPTRGRPSSASTIPITITPAISRSLCPGATSWSSTSGFSKTSQLARAGEAPTWAASRGTKTASKTSPRKSDQADENHARARGSSPSS